MAETLLPGAFAVVDVEPKHELTPEAEMAILMNNGIDPIEIVRSEEAMEQAAKKTGIPVEDLTG